MDRNKESVAQTIVRSDYDSCKSCDLGILKKYEQAELLAGFGHWEIYRNTQTIVSSLGAKKIYGLENRPYSIEEIKSFALPEYNELINKAYFNLVEKNIPYDVEFKIKNQKNGNIVWVHSVGTYDSEKNIVSGSIYDISRQKKSEELIKKSEEDYKRLFQNHHAVMLMIDPDTFEIVHANPAASKFYGWSQSELTN